MTNEEVILQDNSQALVIDAAVDALVATYNDWASLSSEEITGVFDNVGMGFRCLLIFYGGVCRHFTDKSIRVFSTSCLSPLPSQKLYLTNQSLLLTSVPLPLVPVVLVSSDP
eukprot:GHVP01008911.1.p1 GENE.GHVP01008911.1~~GHVP01008911.1.p1  ORF type:complete len:112 (-),score=11.08 GHVP01008911.1:523-858(-)